MDQAYPRDMIGYGRNPPNANWPGGAHVAVQFVINYEEGGENNILHGDAASEAFLSEIVGAAAWPGQRHMNMESIYEYGSRAGFWRLWRMFTDRKAPVTVYGVATALARNPEAVAAMKEAGWEIASHGLKWIEHKDMARTEERRQMAEAIRLHTQVTGERPIGWYTGRSSINTIPLVMEEGGFLYCSDAYADDLPYWITDEDDRAHLIVPYTLDANDMRFATPQGFNAGDQFFTYLKDSFDLLYAEGKAGAPKMMSVGLHCRLVGRPGRAAALARFLDYIQNYERVWIATRADIARHWARHHPPAGLPLARMSRQTFVARFADIFEHTPQIPDRAWPALGPDHDTAEGLHGAFRIVLDAMTREEKLRLINAHPDLAGRLALAKQLTADSTHEQAGAGLDRLTPEELARFTALNNAYRAKFGFPFIMAVKGRSKAEILAAFERRIGHEAAAEFATAMEEISRIALLRLKDRLPSLA